MEQSMQTFNSSRRQCLKSLAGASALPWAFAWNVPIAAAESRKEISFTVLSDTHLGYKGGTGAEQQWERTADQVARQHGSFVLHLGDVIDGGRVEQYAVYRGIRERIACPVYEIPGNHDPADAFAEHLRREIDTVVDHGWLRCVLLNNANRESHDGFFGDDQLDWLERRITEAAADHRLAVVCCHVPVHANKHPDRGWYVKPDHGQGRFYQIMSKHRDTVAALLHGHFHNGIRGWRDHESLHEVCLPSALYNQPRRLMEQQAPGYNPDEFRPGFTQVTIGSGTMSLKYQPTGVESPAIEQKLSLAEVS